MKNLQISQKCDRNKKLSKAQSCSKVKQSHVDKHDTFWPESEPKFVFIFLLLFLGFSKG